MNVSVWYYKIVVIKQDQEKTGTGGCSIAHPGVVYRAAVLG